VDEFGPRVGVRGTRRGIPTSDVSDMTRDDPKRPVSDASAISEIVTQSPLPNKVLVTVHDHDTAQLQRKWPWLLTRTTVTLIFVSIVFSFIILFPLSRSPTSHPSGPVPRISSDATRDRTALPMATSPAFSSNGRTDHVQWDEYTLVLRGQRVLV
jgi:hypothetical protein